MSRASVPLAGFQVTLIGRFWVTPEGYDNVRCLQASDEDFEGWSILREIYEETLYQIRGWLDEVVDFLDDPVAGVKKRGLPADGSGVVNLDLVIKAPRQLNRLTSWSKRRYDLMAAEHQNAWVQEERRARRDDMILGALAGWFIGNK